MNRNHFIGHRLSMSIFRILLCVTLVSGYSYKYTCEDKKHRSHKQRVEELDDTNIHFAVEQWITNRTGAEIRYGPIEFWDTSLVTQMKNLFKDRESFNDDISNWDVSCVTNMHGMFWNAQSFNQPIGGWWTENVENMYSMFRDAFAFNQPLFFDTSNVVDMSNMFYGASAMQGDLSYFDTSNVFSMDSMFRDTEYNGDISMWDVSSLVVSTQMFDNNPAFNSNIKNWEPRSLELFQKMFYEADSFNQKLCWNLPRRPAVKSFQVFCFTEGGKFDPDCVEDEILINANRRCNGWLDDYLAPCLAFFDEVAAFFDEVAEAWQVLCDVVSGIFGGGGSIEAAELEQVES